MFSIDEFARMTMKIILKDGFDDFLPTAIYPDRRHLVVLEGAPEGPSIEYIAFNWASEGAVNDEEFLVAFKYSPSKFKIIQQYSGRKEERVFDVPENNT